MGVVSSSSRARRLIELKEALCDREVELHGGGGLRGRHCVLDSTSWERRLVSWRGACYEKPPGIFRQMHAVGKFRADSAGTVQSTDGVFL